MTPEETVATLSAIAASIETSATPDVDVSAGWPALALAPDGSWRLRIEVEVTAASPEAAIDALVRALGAAKATVAP
jgi:hypothetical protein